MFPNGKKNAFHWETCLSETYYLIYLEDGKQYVLFLSYKWELPAVCLYKRRLLSWKSFDCLINYKHIYRINYVTGNRYFIHSPAFVTVNGLGHDLTLPT